MANFTKNEFFWEGCFLAIFREAIFTFFGKIWSQNGVPGKNNFRQFWYFFVNFGGQNPFFEAVTFIIDFSRKNIEKILKFDPN